MLLGMAKHPDEATSSSMDLPGGPSTQPGWQQEAPTAPFLFLDAFSRHTFLAVGGQVGGTPHALTMDACWSRKLTA